MNSLLSKYYRIYSVLLLICFICFNSCQKEDTSLQKLPEKEKITLILGSSTAAGVGANPPDSSWVNRIQHRLASDHKKVKIINLAKPGFTTYNVLPSNYKTADTARNVNKALSYKPDVIIISLPTNDVASSHTDQEILNNFNIITKTISNSNVAFMIVSSQPRNFSQIELRRRLAILNQKLQANYPGKIINVYDKLVTPDYLINPMYASRDNIHLNNKGHEVIFKTIFNDPLFWRMFY